MSVHVCQLAKTQMMKQDKNLSNTENVRLTAFSFISKSQRAQVREIACVIPFCVRKKAGKAKDIKQPTTKIN